ncbi:hypothetical protein IWX81_002587 [Salinibacterium sp. CAN_S4]|uniref:restriction endonuclease n=1 Tax=Salinibacterium sp. CAN_S4 TaxID=2787727 RepID=UPI0018EF77B6
MDPDATPENVVITSWHEAEAFACGHMRTLGFDDADVTPPGADGGRDVTSRGGVAQVKHFSRGAVGAPSVQQLIGAAAKHRHALFYALTGYSATAVRLADGHEVALFQYDLFGEVTARSEAAERLIDIGFASWEQLPSAANREFEVALQRFGQRTVDAAMYIGGRSADLTKVLTERLISEGRAPEVIDLVKKVQLELAHISALGIPMDGASTRRNSAWLNDFCQLEGLAQSLAARVGLNYELEAEDAQIWAADVARDRAARSGNHTRTS